MKPEDIENAMDGVQDIIGTLNMLRDGLLETGWDKTIAEEISLEVLRRGGNNQ